MKPLFPLVLLLFLTGCRAPSKLVGEWVKQPGGPGPAADVHTTYAADGHFTNVTKIGRATGSSLTATDTGTYALDGDVITFRYLDTDWQFQGDASRIAKAKARFEAEKPKMLAELNKNNRVNVHWDGNDAFTVSDSTGLKESYKRAP